MANNRALALLALAGLAYWWYRSRRGESYILTVDGQDGESYTESSDFLSVAYGLGESVKGVFSEKPNESMGLSIRGAAFIKGWESFRAMPYQASDKERRLGIWTIGYGHTYSGKDFAAVERFSRGITKQEAEKLFVDRVLKDELAIASGVSVPLTQGQFDALVSLRYNMGALGVAAPTLYRALQSGNYEAAADAFMLYVKSGGEVMNGLYRRRAAEMNMFRFGKYDTKF